MSERLNDEQVRDAAYTIREHRMDDSADAIEIDALMAECLARGADLVSARDLYTRAMAAIHAAAAGIRQNGLVGILAWIEDAKAERAAREKAERLSLCVGCGSRSEGPRFCGDCVGAQAMELKRRFAVAVIEAGALARAEERERIARWWDDTETRAAEAHAVYQVEAHRRGDVRHEDAYSDLPESTKEWDRALVRWIAAAIRAMSDAPAARGRK